MAALALEGWFLLAAVPMRKKTWPRTHIECHEQTVMLYDDQDLLLGSARCEIDGLSNKNGRSTGSFNMQYLQLQQEIQQDLGFRFLNALVTEENSPVGATLSGRGWSIRGRERNKSRFMATFTRSAVNAGYLDIAFLGNGIFANEAGLPQQVNWHFEVAGSITFEWT